MSDPNKTASPLGPDPRGPDAVNIQIPNADGQGPSPPHPVTQRESKPSVTQNPMTPRVSDPPDRRTPTSPLGGQGGPSDPIPWSADPQGHPDDLEVPSKPEVPAKPRRDVPETEPVRASQTVQPSKRDNNRVIGTKPTTKGARAKREGKQPRPPISHS